MGKKNEEVKSVRLLDTDIFIDFFRGFNEAKNFIKGYMEEIVFSAISETELLSGKECNDPNDKERILHILSKFKKVAVDNPITIFAGDIRRIYGLEVPDAILAASAMSTGSILVTRNIKDFKNIKGLKIHKPY